MNCPKCTMPLLPDARFCGSCGFTLQAATSNVSPPTPQAAPPPPNYQPQAPAGGAFHFDADGRGQGRGYTWAIEYQGHLL